MDAYTLVLNFNLLDNFFVRERALSETLGMQGTNLNSARSAHAGLRNEELPALFWDEIPDDADNPDVAAINAINEETSPEERASNFKEMGNRALKTGISQKKKYYLRQAIEQYSQGIDIQCNDAELNSILYANRAHVNLLLGNDRNAILDGKDAARYNPQNVKAYFRAAKGALKLEYYDECIDLCQRGLLIEPENTELVHMRKTAEGNKAAEASKRLAIETQQYNARAPARELCDAILGRSIKIGRPQFAIGLRKPQLQRDLSLTWPVLFFYPEASMAQDAIEEFHEENTFAEHLNVMFGPEAPPLEWDLDHRYRRDSVELYFLSYAAKPLERAGLVEALYGGWPSVSDDGPLRYGPQAAQWIRLEESWTLARALQQPGHIVPGIPVFFILARDTPFKEDFLQGDIALLR